MKLFAIEQFSEKYDRPLYFNLRLQCIWQNDINDECILEEDTIGVWQSYLDNQKITAKIIEIEEASKHVFRKKQQPLFTSQEVKAMENWGKNSEQGDVTL